MANTLRARGLRSFTHSPKLTVLNSALLGVACVTLTGITAARDSAGGPSSASASSVSAGTALPAAAVFADGQVVDYRITLDPAVWTQLEEHGDDEEYVPAELNLTGKFVGSQAIGSVGLRHKGSWTLHHCWDDFGGVRSHEAECAKLSYKIKFNAYKKDTRYEGLKQLNLHAASGDATKLHELLAYSTFRDFGVDTCRAAPARLYINNQFQGLFFAVEEVEGRYTETHYPEGGSGNLYKEVWPRDGQPDQYFISGLETNKNTPDVSDMQAFAAAIAATSEQTFRADLRKWVDVDHLLRYMAVDRASKNWDGVTAFYSPISPHNFYWYHDNGPEGRFHLIPWDMDNTFWDFDPYMAPEQWVTAEPIPDWNVLPLSCAPMSVWEPYGTTRITPPGCDPLLRMLAKTQWDRFVSIGHELMRGPLRLDRMLAKVVRWSIALEPIIAKDPYVDLATWRQVRNQFPLTLLRILVDFNAFLERDYTVEKPDPSLYQPSQAELDAPMPESGIELDHVNNYEFAGGASNPPAGIYWYGADGVSAAPTWNTSEPNSGSADLRFDFAFTRVDGAWNEWVQMVVPTQNYQEQDVSSYTQISVTLRTDRPRAVRVWLSSPAYDEMFGGAWPQFGTEFYVSTTPQTFKLRRAQLYYPDWAKADWAGSSKGWSTSDSDALAILLSRFNGLIFAPQAVTTPDGELAEATDSGFVQIDNIYFQ